MRRIAAAAGVLVLALAPPAGAATAKIDGAGSTWSSNALDQWRRDVAGQGLVVNYVGSGSSDGRAEFAAGQVDFAVSEIPFQTAPTDGSRPERPTRPYAYVPIVAGGTSLMYHLTVAGREVTALRLSGWSVAKIFTRATTWWDDPQLVAENPGIALPHEPIVPVVRADAAGTTAQFTSWLAGEQGPSWQAYCAQVGRPLPCGATSSYPIVAGLRAQAGSSGVASYVAQPYGEGSITYVEESYAQLAGFPVARLLNQAGYYVAPTPSAVAVALLAARPDEDPRSPNYLIEQLAGVYANPDPRAYPLSSYSYLIVPTTAADGFGPGQGAALAAFADYAICRGQQDVTGLGYSPLPVNLVRAGRAQLARVPGARPGSSGLTGCQNPTFSADGRNALAVTAPYPRACDRAGPQQCSAGGPALPAVSVRRDGATPVEIVAPSRVDYAGRSVQVPDAGGWTGAQTVSVVVLGGLFAALVGPPLALRARRRRRVHGRFTSS